MNKHLANGCTDARLAEWSDRAFAHEVVNATHQMKDAFGDAGRLFDVLEALGATKADMDSLLGTEGLHITFDGLGRHPEHAYQATVSTCGLVVLGEEFVINGEQYREVLGLMTHDEFWAFLGSFPNVYKHLKAGDRERIEFFQRKKATN